MSDEVWVSGVRLTAEQVAWLNEHGRSINIPGNQAAEILFAVWGALPVGTP